MKNILKKIFYPVFFTFVDKHSYFSFDKSPNLFKLFFYSTRFRLASNGIYLTKNEKWLASLKNKYKGERCFIIGNGPSLNKMDLTKLKNEYTFGVNAIYLNYEKMQFHPTFYVVEDYLVAEDRASEINKYKGPKLKFFGSYLDYVLTKDENTITTNVLLNYDEPFTPFFTTNLVRSLGVGGSVTFMCLQLAYFLGFEKVYMIGFDHNYAIPKEANLDTSTVIMSESDDVNHFSKDYFGKGYRWHDPKVDRMEMGFTKARDAFKKDSRNVWNATVGGHLDVFERVNYDDLFSK
ncbi:6-hydroxymethylpterin diphosphokinase MptE-like protein [Mucilaginibacter gilvus]|uniref:DUF115 domain-containing protein n=1 Tax=Mucilaginibacter gilvus TaxID=2305909 RepID=A0A3S3X0V3_9SPHI|nr:6-hydroxymethylpterin diphosphokinase MptE-like protein [Mucilaginibacter gilvus]RWY48111.1 DUF115 domain-containing protein [Mucilaginibacter gilvus]